MEHAPRQGNELSCKMDSVFLYDQQVPVALTVLSEGTQDEATSRISYTSPLGSLVSAYLTLILASKPQAGLIFGHWEREMKKLGRGRHSCPFRLCLAVPQSFFRRPVDSEPQKPRRWTLQWIVDVRRAVDFFTGPAHA